MKRVASIALALGLLWSGGRDVFAQSKPAPPAAAPNPPTPVAPTAASTQSTTVDSPDFKTDVDNLQTLAKNLTAYCATPTSEAVRTARAPSQPVSTKKKTDDTAAAAKADDAANQKLLDDSAKLCSAFVGIKATQLDISPFANRELATIGVAIDTPTVRKVASAITAQLAALKPQALDTVAIRAGGPLLIAAKAAYDLQTQLNAGNVQDLGSYATNLLATGLEGLAKLIVDRARFEASGWFLDTVGEHLCQGDGKDPWLAKEMSTYWLPSVCDLSNQKQLWEYGAGSALWQSVQTATKKDLTGFPGNGIGLGISALYLSDAPLEKPPEKSPEKTAEKKKPKPDAPPPDLKSPFSCDDKDYGGLKQCVASLKLRQSTLQAALRLQSGQKATRVLEDWSGDLTTANATSPSERLQKIACLVSIPAYIESHQAAFAASLDARSVPRVLVFAALVSEPACLASGAPLGFTLGKVTSCDYSGATCDQAKAASNSELLTNLGAKKDLVPLGADVQTAVRRLIDAVTALDRIHPGPSKSTLAERADAVFEVGDAAAALGIDLVDTALAVETQPVAKNKADAYAEVKPLSVSFAASSPSAAHWRRRTGRAPPRVPRLCSSASPTTQGSRPTSSPVVGRSPCS